MTTYAQKLHEARALFNACETMPHPRPNPYDRDCLPETLAYLDAFIATREYPYNAQVAKYIKSKEEIPAELNEYLDTEIYLAQQTRRRREGAKKDEEMRAQGYEKITTSVEYRGQAVIVAKKDMDWMSAKIETEGKIIEDSRGYPFFIPKGKRTRGYSFLGIDGYYKQIK